MMQRKTSSFENQAQERMAGFAGNTGQTARNEEVVQLSASPQKTILEALAEQEIFLEGGCSGKGRCGRCRVRYPAAAPLPAASERRFLSAKELREGIRLACLHRVDRDCRVEVRFTQAARIDIVTAAMQQPFQGSSVVSSIPNRDASGRDPLCAGQDGEPAEEWKASDWCITIDLGTTTIAMQARSLRMGGVLAEWRAMNPQRRFGSDVISRMEAALSGKGEELQACVSRALSAGIQEIVRKVALSGAGCSGMLSGLDGAAALPDLDAAMTLPDSNGDGEGWAPNPVGIYLAGNTVMEHLLAGLSVKELSRHPFVPVTLDEQRIWLDRPVTLLPGLSAFVGADLLAGVLACRMHEREEISLLIDLGTNGELVLGNREKLMCTATAAGPAFEGGPGNAAPGTDMIAVIAELMDAGIVDETGLLEEPWFAEGIDWPQGASARTHITQEEIRAIQMAKAAIYAGICVLIGQYGISFEKIDTVWLAGGFGYYLDVDKAARIGLFPRALTGRVRSVGNTSLAGSFLYGRNAAKEEAARIKQICRAINLAEQTEFEEIYLAHLNLGADNG